MKFKLKKILCSIDFSKYSKSVVEYGTELALQSNAVVYIFHSVFFPGRNMYGAKALVREDETKKRTEQAGKEIRKLMEDKPVDWKPLISSGEPVAELKRVATELNPDLIIAASRGFSGLKRILLGTVVERMARTLSQPLLVIREPLKKNTLKKKEFFKIKNVVVGCDFSDDSLKCIQYAISFAKELQTKLTLLHSITAPIDEEIINPTMAPYNISQEALMEQLLKRINLFIPSAIRNEINVKTIVVPGVPGEVLPEYARQNSSDLIVVGVKHVKGLRKVIIGSTTEAVLRHAHCNVLSIPL